MTSQDERQAKPDLRCSNRERENDMSTPDQDDRTKPTQGRGTRPDLDYPTYLDIRPIAVLRGLYVLACFAQVCGGYFGYYGPHMSMGVTRTFEVGLKALAVGAAMVLPGLFLTVHAILHREWLASLLVLLATGLAAWMISGTIERYVFKNPNF